MGPSVETSEATEQLLTSRDEASSEAALARLKRSYVVCGDDGCRTVSEVAAVALPRLCQALLDPDPIVRVMACRGLGFFAADSDESHIGRLVAMLDDSVVEVRIDALDALGEFGPLPEAAIARATQIASDGPTMEERARALYLFMQPMLPDDAIRALLVALTSGVPSVQAAAASTLSHLLENRRGDAGELQRRASAALASFRGGSAT